MSTLPHRIPVTQQIPVITAGLAVPQPSTGLDCSVMQVICM